MNKHTSGKWSVQGKLDNLKVVSTLNEGEDDEMTGLVAIVRCYDHHTPNYETSEANARLIAAAPELLEALKQLVQHIEWREDFLIEDADEGEQNAYTLAQAAIDKATK